MNISQKVILSSALTMDLTGKYDTWQDVLGDYPPSGNIDTDQEIKCYEKGIGDGFEKGQPSQ